MSERRSSLRGRTLRSGKILFNNRSSIIDCVVRNLSEGGASLQLDSAAGVPETFELLLDGEETPRRCRLVWQANNRVGLAFGDAQRVRDPRPGQFGAAAQTRPPSAPRPPSASAPREPGGIVRTELLTLRAALDEVEYGVVLLDPELRAEFINRAFRRMWRLPDAKADAKPAFVALMYHGRDTRAYDIPASELDAYVAARVAAVKAGDTKPLNLPLANGEILRFQCAVLPAGGRMLSYTYVTDIVRQAEDMKALRAALDQVQLGIILLDADLNVRFVNGIVRQLSGITDADLAAHPSFAELVRNPRRRRALDLPADEIEAFFERRIAQVRAGDATPTDLRIAGRIVRATCTVLPGGGRMLTYNDVSDLVRHAEELDRLATVDGLTEVFNRRHFMALANAEWSRFQRYARPLSLLIVDIDHFKLVNDRFGHDAGDHALSAVARVCMRAKRSADIVARIGGEEFALLLPETTLAQAAVVAERLRAQVSAETVSVNGEDVRLTVSIGAAEARLGMPAVDALMKAADAALYRAKADGRNRVVCAVGETGDPLELAAE